MPPTLPDDILLLICDALEDREDKLKLLLLNHDLYDFFLPVIYSNLKFTVRYTQVPYLVNSIRRNPRIGNVIRELHLPLDESYESVGEDDIYDPRPFRDTLEQVTDTEGQLSLWMNGMNEGYWCPWVALLFMSLANVEKLVISYEKKFANILIWMLSKIAAKHRPFDGDTVAPLQRLEDVTLVVDGLRRRSKAYLPARGFLPFFKLPAMRAFRAEGLYDSKLDRDVIYGDDNPFTPISPMPQPKSSSVREIRLGRLCHSNRGMSDYITSCANLEIFEYQHYSTEASLDSFYPESFHNALSTQKHSLQVLHLNNRGDQEPYIPSNEPEDQPHWLGSLAGFTKLRELRIPCDNLFNRPEDDEGSMILLQDSMPSSLEYLYIGNILRYSLGFLAYNLESVHTQRLERSGFPALKKIDFEMDQILLMPGEVTLNVHCSDGVASMNLKEMLLSLMLGLKQEGIKIEIDYGRHGI